MRSLLSIVLVLLAAAASHAQNYNSSYAVNIGITYHALKGSVPAEIKITPPAYPSELRRVRVSGAVDFELTVQEDGRVSDTRVMKSSQKEFEAPALEALNSWRFRHMKDNPDGSARPLQLGKHEKGSKT